MQNSNNYSPIVPMFQKFITEALTRKRLQKNGKIISSSTIHNYNALLSNLKKFEILKNRPIQINVHYRYSKRNFEKERVNYRKFYKDFTDFLYTRNCIDNYVGSLIKTLRSFYIYLNEVKGYNTGAFYKLFYVRREDTPVIVLSQVQLRYLISDLKFEESLPLFLRTTKDIFVLGCTVGLRFSDLMLLRPRNLEKESDKVYLVTVSKKTNTATRIKLPCYAIKIIDKYRGKQSALLPFISLNQFNDNLKRIADLANWKYEIGKVRTRRGVRKEIKINGKIYRFCDIISSHVMRRTAITTLLLLGMPEPLVRKISGHAANSKEFYKYVKYTESFMDTETDKAFDKLMETV